MIRIIAVATDCADAAHVSGPVHIQHLTFDIRNEKDILAFQDWWDKSKRVMYRNRSIIGVEVLP